MRSLSSSDGSKSKLTLLLEDYVDYVCVLLYVAGLIYLFGVVWPAFNNRTYFSENALLPGLVDEHFSHGNRINSFARDLNKQLGNKENYTGATAWLHGQFVAIGLESYIQNFTVTLPVVLPEPVSGSNVYGILRSPRGSATEAMVVCVPYRMDSIGAISLIMAVAAHSREQIYWSKDIIFVVSEHEQIGIQAWLSAYHDLSIPAIKTAPLAAHSGSIQAAISLDIVDGIKSFSHADVKFNMINGQLPNLDLVNLAVKMIQKEALEPTLFEMEEHWNMYSYEGYIRMLTTSLKGLIGQARSRADGLHSLFGQYGIEAVTLRPYNRQRKRGRSGVGWVEMGRILESMLRSVNNLLERFHQSFFFYFLPSTHRYVSIGLFMPAIGLLLLAPALKAWMLWIEVNDPKHDNPKSDDNSLLTLAPYLVMAHLSGLAVYYLPALLGAFLPPDNNEMLFTGSAGCLTAFISFPWLLSRNMKNSRMEGQRLPSNKLMRSVLLLEMALMLGVESVFNFGLAYLLAAICVPVCLLAKPSSNRMAWAIRSGLLLVLNPLVFTFVSNLTYASVQSKVVPNLWSLLHSAYNLTKTDALSIIADSYLYGSNLMALISFGLFPLWILFWTLSQQNV